MLLMEPLIKKRHMHNPMRPVEKEVISQHEKAHLPNDLPLGGKAVQAVPEIDGHVGCGDYEQTLEQ